VTSDSFRTRRLPDFHISRARVKIAVPAGPRWGDHSNGRLAGLALLRLQRGIRDADMVATALATRKQGQMPMAYAALPQLVSSSIVVLLIIVQVFFACCEGFPSLGTPVRAVGINSTRVSGWISLAKHSRAHDIRSSTHPARRATYWNNTCTFGRL